MSETYQPEEYQYDAFISYRHLPLDSAVAVRVQKLLESYKAPIKGEDGKRLRIKRIFRDQSELPTSGSLDDSLKRALLSSRFLIVVLSKQTKDSKWCMEEIKNFKEANGGKISHILPILIEGEPDESLPDILRYETRVRTLEDGSTETYDVELEPLCCDIRADSLKGSLKKLKTEVLRICAPIFEVGFDDLFMRHKRRKRKIAITSACISVAVLLCIAAVISFFALQTYNANKQRQIKLVESFTQQGAAMMAKGDYEKALAYYNNVLELDSDNQAAKTGSLLLLQQCGMLNIESTGTGYITGSVLYNKPSGSNVTPFAVNSSGKNFLVMTTKDSYYTDENFNPLENLDEFGNFISCAKDGSCWSFVNKNKITFYFPDELSYIQVDRPTKINPRCGDVSNYFFDDEDRMSSIKAMTLDKKHAAVYYGGYVYFYKVNIKESKAQLLETIDLAMFFDEDSGSVNMSPLLYMWTDPNSNLCVASNGTASAVFYIHEDKVYVCGENKEYWHYLSNVAFSEDGKHYALVFGNYSGHYDNPGGCIKVYDEYGKICFETDFDSGSPLVDAMFKPDSTLIAAWGKGVLQIWDWSKGSSVAAPLQIKDISSAVWTDNNRIAVSDNKGKIEYYCISKLNPETSDVKLKKSKKVNFRNNSVKLSSGYTINNNAIGISVTDSNNKTTDEFKPENGNFFTMFVDKNKNTAYAWNSLFSRLISVTVDENGKITTSNELNTQGKNPVGVYAVKDGVLAEMGDGDIMYYKDGNTEPEGIIQPGYKGYISCLAYDESGLVSFVIRNKNLLGGIDFKFVYTAELWDLNNMVKLAEFEHSTKEITDLTFASDNRFAYSLDGEKVIMLLDIPSPDKKAISTLKNMSCYSISEDGKISIKAPSFSADELGNWKSYFSQSDEAEKDEDQPFTSKMQDILDEKGKDAWIEEYNKWWKSDEPKKLELSELTEIAKDYYKTAINEDLQKECKIGITVYFEIFNSSPSLTTYEIMDSGYLANDVLAFTPENLELIKAYDLNIAEYFESSYKKTKDDSYDLVCAYSYRYILNLMDGKGSKAFDIDESIMDGIYSEKKDILTGNETVKVYISLFNGKPKLAAQQFEKNIPSSEIASKSSYCYMFLNELHAYVKIGILPEKDYSEFLKELDCTTGTELRMVSVSQLKAGLHPGDVVTAVNGFYFGVPRYFMSGKKVTPEKVTYIHNGEVLTAKAEANWEFIGGFPIDE